MKKFAAITLCAFLFTIPSVFAESTKSYMEGYSLNKKYCMSCHDSVADPEKPGLTRDEWHLVLNLMHQKGLQKLSNEEKEILVDYFYTIRKGIEQEAG